MKTHKTASLKVFATTALLTGLAGTSASAALVASDLNTGGADTGFSNAWSNGSSNVFIIDAPDLTYANYSITQTGTTDKVYTANASPDRQDVRTLASAMSGEIWFSVLVNVPAGSEYAGLTFNNSGNSYDPVTTAARVLMGPTQLQVGLNGGAAAPGSGTFSAGTTHLLLGKMNVVAGNDTLEVWVDPDVIAAGGPGGLGAANFTSTTVDFASSITDIGVAGRKGNNGSDVFVDAFRLSDTNTAFTDVTGVVPEPGSLALLGLGGLLIGARRRRG